MRLGVGTGASPAVSEKLQSSGAGVLAPTIVVTAAAAARPKEPVALTLGVASGNVFTAQTESIVNSAVNELAEEEPDLDVKAVQVNVGGDLTNFGDSYIAAVESAFGEGKTLDILAIPGPGVLRDLADKGRVHDVDRFMAQMDAEEGDTFYAIAEAAITHNGKRWALP